MTSNFGPMYSGKFYSFYTQDELLAFPIKRHISTSFQGSMAQNPYKMADIINPAII